MQLHELKPNYKSRSKTRVGRGGKRGTMSGRGQKGQKSRSGHRIRPEYMDLIQRLPKLRGLKNKAIKPKPAVVNVGELANIKESLITLDVLKSNGLVGKKYRGAVKVLGDGEIKNPIEVKGFKVSATAKEKIEKAGGKVS